jgi:hypothetical protein
MSAALASVRARVRHLAVAVDDRAGVELGDVDVLDGAGEKLFLGP